MICQLFQKLQKELNFRMLTSMSLTDMKLISLRETQEKVFFLLNERQQEMLEKAVITKSTL